MNPSPCTSPMATEEGRESSMEVSWPMVEREHAFRQIHSAITTPGSRSAATGVVLTGDAGVGKTTLARYVARSMTDTAVRWVAGTESARNVPLGAFGHLIGQSALQDPVAFLTIARTALVGAGSAVIGVDDAHLLDQLSATLLLQLAIDRSARIIATVRSGERVPDAITSLWKDGHLNRIELRPFTRTESIGLVESVLDGKLEGLSADLLWSSSGGNALYLRHLVEAALEAGSLRQVQGVWQLRGHAGVTSELASLLGDRVTVLPTEIQHVLRLLSLCEPMDISVLSTLAGEENVEDTERRDLLRVVEDGVQLNARFTHPMFGEVVRCSLGVAGARRLRGEIVTAMRAAGHNTKADTVRLAELALGCAADSHQYAIEAEALHAAARFGDGSVQERIAELVTVVDGDLVVLYARHALALDRQDADALEECGRSFETLGAKLSATDALAQAAAHHEADGNRTRAAVTATAAYRIAATCGGVTTPALSAVPDPSPLTVREREIAGLIAAGLSNSDIAERLVLSVRTVESHIYRGCAKLDVTDRDQLAAITGHE